jgi:hypothetical protein
MYENLICIILRANAGLPSSPNLERILGTSFDAFTDDSGHCAVLEIARVTQWALSEVRNGLYGSLQIPNGEIYIGTWHPFLSTMLTLYIEMEGGKWPQLLHLISTQYTGP